MTLVWKANTRIYWPSQSAGFLAYNEGDVVPDANVALYGYDTQGVVDHVDVTTSVPGSGGAAHVTVDALNTLKAELPTNVREYGAAGDGVTDDTTAIQFAIDSMRTLYLVDGRPRTVYLPPGNYKVSASTLSETYDNYGVAWPASDHCLTLRAGVSLVGESSTVTRIFATNTAKTLLGMVAPVDCQVRGITFENAWTPGDSGIGHGIFTLATQSSAVIACANNTWQDLVIKNVGSYGLGLQNGFPTGCHIDSVKIDTIGADGLDLKARGYGATPTEPNGNHCSNITIRNHGRRVTSSGGIDVRGVWHLTSITVVDFGNDATLEFIGVRFRTKSSEADYWTAVGSRSTLDGFYIRALSGAASTSMIGVLSGSDYVHVANGTVENCTVGVQHTGNVVGNSIRNSVTGVAAVNCITYGFEADGITTTGLTYSACHSTGTVGGVGFRNEGTTTTYIGCSATEVTPIESSGGASPTQVTIGCRFFTDSDLSVGTSASGRVAVAAVGASSNIDILLSPKGTGVVRLGTLTASADAPVSGYITIRDSGGTLRKIAVIT